MIVQGYHAVSFSVRPGGGCVRSEEFAASSNIELIASENIVSHLRWWL